MLTAWNNLNHLISLQSDWFLKESSVTIFGSIHVLNFLLRRKEKILQRKIPKRPIYPIFPSHTSLSKATPVLLDILSC
ncbi:unnamed protein product [Rhizophagus irregularis]|nr:unnamed protein product [Rhizophagus irregularis]